MQTFEDFGRWVGKMGGQEGLALAYEKELGKKVSQSAISGWFKSRRIPEPRRPDLKTLGWRGPWEWPEESKVESAPARGPYATASEVAELRGALRAHVEQWERGTEKLLERLEALARKVDRLVEGGK
jgi:hypothetical protein